MTRPSWTTHSHAFAGCIQSGTGFPDGRALGKSVPEFGFGMGCSFRLRGLAESATRNLQSEWDEVSQRSHKRKLHPTPNVNSGTRFPDAKSHMTWPSSYMCCGYPPHDKPRSNNKASVRAGNLTFRAARADEPVKTCRYLILVVPGARLGSVSLASVWKCSV